MSEEGRLVFYFTFWIYKLFFPLLEMHYSTETDGTIVGFNSGNS